MAPHARQKVGAGCFDFVMSKKRRGVLQYVLVLNVQKTLIVVRRDLEKMARSKIAWSVRTYVIKS